MDIDEYDSGVAGESQPSQLLKNVLEPEPEEDISSRNNTIPVDEYDYYKDSSADSVNSHSAPQYHYHGLASTQTQSQQCDDESNPNDEGSQKENAGSSREALSSSGNQVQGVARVQSCGSPEKAPLVDKTRRSPTKSTNNTKVTFEPPKAAEAPVKLPEARSTGRSLRRATAARKRDPSQDSFAGDFEDPAERLIASSKQFAIPFAELVVASPQRGSSHVARKTMYADDMPLPESGRAAPSVKETLQAITNDNQGKVLVDSTPSGSQSQPSQPSQPSQSQSQSQGYGQEQPDDEYIMDAHQPEDYIVDGPPADASGSQNSTQYESSEPSSSYRNMYANFSPAPEPTQILTQLVDEPTQIIEPTQLVDHSHTESVISSNAEKKHGDETFSNVTSTTHARTLLDSLDERKRNRYAAHISRIDHNPATTTSYSNSAVPAVPLAWQETQPAFEPDDTPAPVLATLPPADLKQSGVTASRLRQALVDERTEVIPDSEPPREGSLSPVPPAKLPTGLHRPASPDTETDAEVVPDSMDVDVDGENRNEVLSMRQEEEEEEEEEIPLSTTSLKRKGGKGGKRADPKGKGKAVEMGPPPIKPKATRARTMGEPASAKKPDPPKKRRTRNESPEVPSSVPNQDLTQVVKAKHKMAARTKSATAPRVRKRVGGSIKRVVRDETDEEESSDDELPNSEGEEEVRTESASDDEYIAGPSTRKRKRGIKVESPSVQYPPKARRAAAKPSTSARPAKRVRGASGSTHNTYNAVEPTRVFALWRTDGNYYSGVVHSQASGPGRYRVNFDDGTSADVKLDQMRLCTPRVGDTAFIAALHFNVEIVKVLNLEDGMVSVRADTFSKDIHVSELRIPSKTIGSGEPKSRWADRMLTAQSIVCAVKPSKSLTSPTPSRMSIASTSSSSRKPFSKIGFCITHALEPPEDKEVLATRIRNNGGTVIDDWEDVIPMKGKLTSNRWTLVQKDAKPAFGSVQRVFLLSDEASQTPKYLLALALGIPCLRLDFINHVIQTGDLDWMMYLLPTGFSEILNCRVSQFVNVDWGDGVDDLKDLMNNSVAYKVFKGKKIMCVSPEVLTKKTPMSIPRIMLAMGAECVETVREIKHASHDLAHFDYIVNKDNSERVSTLRGYTVVSWEWVKEALISGRLSSIA